MKRVLTIIVVTIIIFLIGFVFLRVQNEEFAETLLDDAGLNTARIRKNRATMSWSVMTGATMSGQVMTWDTMSWAMLSWDTMTWSTSSGEQSTWTMVLSGTLQIEVN